MKNKIRSFATGYQNCCRQVLKTRLILTQGFDIITSHKLWLSAAVLSLNMIVSGCGGGKANVDTEDENIVCLTGTPVSTDDDLYVFDICAATDTVLYGQAALQPFFVEKFRLSGSEAVLTDSLGRKGNGPEEMSSAQCCFDSKNNKLYLWSPTDLRCYSYDLNEASLQPNALNVLYNQPNQLSIVSLCVVNDSLLIAPCLDFEIGESTSPTWFTLLNTVDGNVVRLKGFNVEDNNDLPTLQTQLIYNAGAKLSVNPNTSKVAYVSGKGTYAEVFEISGDSIINRNVLMEQILKYGLASDGINVGYSKNYEGPCYCELATSDDYIFIAPSRTTVQNLGSKPDVDAAPATSNNFLNTIKVYDWDGNYIKTFEITPMVTNIAVTPGSRYIYGISEDENFEPIIMRFETGL